MNKKTIHITFIFALLLSASCQRVLDIDLSKEKPLIVMNGTIMPDSPIIISIGKSYSILDTDSMAPFLKDVSVELHINDKFVEKMYLMHVDSARNGGKRGTSYFSSTAHAGVGDKVRIEAKAPGLEPAWAETTIPAPPIIGKVDTTLSYVMLPPQVSQSEKYGYYRIFPDSITMEPFIRMMQLRIDLQADKSDSPQYFMLYLSTMEPHKDNDMDSIPSYLPIDTKDDPIFANDPKNSFFDIIFEKNNSRAASTLFTDNLFANGAYTLNVNTLSFYKINLKTEKSDENESNSYYNSYYGKYVSHEVINSPIKIHIYALSADHYRYLKSITPSSYDDELFYISEPSVTVSNVKNGIGVVSAMSSTKKEIQIPPYPGGKNTIPW